jgi:hypothetical protein
MDLDLVGQQIGALVAFIPPMSIEDHPLHWTLVRSHTYHPEHILTYGGRKTCYSLIMGSGSFRTDCYGLLLGWRSKHHTKAGSAVLWSWSPSLDGDLDPLTGVEQVGLTCDWGTSEACVFLGHIDSQIAVST